MKKSIIIICYAILFLGTSSITLAQTLDKGLTSLTDQIIRNMIDEKKKKIAVFDLSDLEGNPTDIGRFFAEELTSRLFLTKRFEIVERRLLNTIIEEQKLTLTGLIDEATARDLGKLLGIDAICTGTVTDLGVSIKINSRLISTETGAVFAIASVKLRKDRELLALMKQEPILSEETSEENLVLDSNFANFGKPDGPWGTGAYSTYGIWWNSNNARSKAQKILLKPAHSLYKQYGIQTALYIKNDSPTAGHVFGTTAQKIKVKPNQQYTLSLWASSRNLSRTGAVNILADPTWSKRLIHIKSGNTEWTKYSAIFNVGNVSYIDLRILSEDTGEVWLTGFSMYESVE